MPGITDMGGAVIDLQGASFKINKPIRLPAFTGNIVVRTYNVILFFYTLSLSLNRIYGAF